MQVVGILPYTYNFAIIYNVLKIWVVHLLVYLYTCYLVIYIHVDLYINDLRLSPLKEKLFFLKPMSLVTEGLGIDYYH